MSSWEARLISPHLKDQRGSYDESVFVFIVLSAKTSGRRQRSRQHELKCCKDFVEPCLADPDILDDLIGIELDIEPTKHEVFRPAAVADDLLHTLEG